MSESQFAYSGLTLDELRSLAASPQVGTLHAMPQSFRALADRVGEVADLLTHTQVNMHHWWKGPAAEQAAAMLGQAAAEAREFHGSALAAAASVARCAQVVEAQQHQMMNVPEVAEPGVTDVVPRPTTPFEALEAARRDVAYQAAHEQAVQVVNGIAAQYVETHGELTSINTLRGNNFSTPIPADRLEHSASSSGAAVPRSPNSVPSFASSSYGDSRHIAAKTVHKAKPTRTAASGRSVLRTVVEVTPTRGKEQLEPASEHEDVLRSATWPLTEAREDGTHLSDSHHFEAADDISWQRSSSGAYQSDHASVPPATIVLDSSGKESKYQRRDSFSPTEVDSTLTPTQNSRELQSRLAADPLAKNGNYSESAMIPPYSGIGSFHNARERRNPRPAYLKERKSVWLPKTIAAPPDGVITPEWLEQE